MLQSRWGCSSGCSGDQWGLADKEGVGMPSRGNIMLAVLVLGMTT